MSIKLLKKQIRYSLLILILTGPQRILSQHNLVIGNFDYYQDTIINGASANFDTILVMNHGNLTITNSTITINHMLVVTDSAYMQVNSCNFNVNGKCVFYGNSETYFKDTITLNAHLVCGANAVFTIDSSYVNSNMTFMGQYEVLGFENGRITFNNSFFNLFDGKYGGGLRNNAVFSQYNSIYSSSVGMGMTLGLHNTAMFTSDNCSGGIELLIKDTATVTLNNSETFILWFCFENGDTVHIDFPATNATNPPSGNVSDYIFPGIQPDITGVDFNVEILNCNTIYWALMLYDGCDVTIYNDSLLAVGLYYNGKVTDTLDGFINNLNYDYYVPSLSDRSLTLNNSLVFAWNFYPSDSSKIIIKNSLFGEVLTSYEAVAELINSTCDGSGGYVGSSENSSIFAKNTHIQRTYDGPPIILNNHNSFIILENCLIEGNIILNQNSKLILNNTIHKDSILLNDNSYFLNVSIDTIDIARTNSIIDINGSLYDMKGYINSDMITGLKLVYTTTDTMNMVTLIDSVYSPIIKNGLFYSWNTIGLTAGEYILWLTVYVNNDSLATASQKIILTDFTGTVIDYNKPVLFKVYPNPAKNIFNISVESKKIDDFEIVMLDIIGNIIIKEKNKLTFNIADKKSGLYIVRFITKNEIDKQMLIIN